MRQWELSPDEISFGAANRAREERAEGLLLFELSMEMRHRNVDATAVSYIAAIRACEKGAACSLPFESTRETRKGDTYAAVASSCTAFRASAKTTRWPLESAVVARPPQRRKR